MIWTNKISRRLGLVYPIIQAPMLGVTTPEMVAATAKIHALGTLSLGDMSADKCVQAIRQTKSLTDRKFAVNIFAHRIPMITDAIRLQYDQTRKKLEQLSQQYHLDVRFPSLDELTISSYQEQIDAVIAEKCAVLSFTFGNLDKESIAKLKNADITIIGTCTSVAEALALENSGVDMVCVQGIEAGGHRGSFDDEHIPQIGGFSLLSQVYASVRVPVIYAGGVYNGNTLRAAKELGAQGYQVGSLLLGSKESGLKNFEKKRLQEVQEADIILTKSFSGRMARGIQNNFTKALDGTDFILPYPYQNKLTDPLRKKAKEMENPELVNIWVGQSLHPFSDKSTSEILLDLIADAEEK